MKVQKILWMLIALSAPFVTHSAELNIDDKGIALHGYDPVAYVLTKAPTMGNASFSTEYGGATYYFASQQNLDFFLENPDQFEPQYGGFCSYGVRVGKKFDVDPAAFSVVDNRLFMLLNKATHAIWLQDRDKNIEIADRLWPSIMSVPEDQLTSAE